MGAKLSPKKGFYYGLTVAQNLAGIGEKACNVIQNMFTAFVLKENLLKMKTFGEEGTFVQFTGFPLKAMTFSKTANYACWIARQVLHQTTVV